MKKAKRAMFSLLAAALAAGMLLTAAPAGMVAAAEQPSAIAGWRFDRTGAVAEDGLPGGDKDTGYAATDGSGTLFASVSGDSGRKLEWSKDLYDTAAMAPVMTGGTKNPWGSGAYFLCKVSTTGYQSVAFSASLGGTKKGPRDWKLQISTDGTSFTDVPGATYAVSANKTLEPAFRSVVLPVAAANVSELYIRLLVTSENLIGGGAGLTGSTGGEAAIDAVSVTGIPTAPAEQQVTFSMNAPRGQAGDLVMLNVDLSANSYLVNMDLSVLFDASKLQLQKAYTDGSGTPVYAKVNAAVLPGMSAFALTAPGRFQLGYADSGNTVAGGTMFTLVFKILSDVVGPTPVTLSADPIRANATDPADQTQDYAPTWGFTGGIVTITGGTTTTTTGSLYQTGDINRDGVTGDMRDARLLFQYVSGTAQLDAEQRLLADVTGRGEADMLDARRLFQIAAGQ